MFTVIILAKRIFKILGKFLALKNLKFTFPDFFSFFRFCNYFFVFFRDLRENESRPREPGKMKTTTLASIFLTLKIVLHTRSTTKMG